MASTVASGRIRAVLFDLDGTLVDSLAAIVAGLGDTLERYAGRRPPRERIVAMVGLPLSKQVAVLDPVPPSEDAIRERVRFAETRFAAHSHLEAVFPHTKELLNLCRGSGIPTAIVTSKTRTEFEAFRTRHPWVEGVDAVVCSTDVERGKPSPDSALLARSLLEVSSGRVVFVGDSTFDVACARAAGCEAWAVAYGAGDRRSLEASLPDRLFEHPRELLQELRKAIDLHPCHARN
ncbi:MAG TPA: hypothetical protein DER07_07390 [Armatimonadetes bacterium]|jgi:phosphoglycolate phosphatase-like HAD superfamily hydrolase|nr:HAD family hydrolase [Armatimonadota bacterium]HCE00853.1 hypothetical protein [Armatimonadota bacterium]